MLITEPMRAWSVAGLLLAASDALQARLGAVTVHGELSGFTRASSGHCYFTLKDDEGNSALLRCAMFRRAAVLLDFSPADGQQVELRGRIAVYEARGELQCVVESMQRLGAGSLYEIFLRLKSALGAAGLFDPQRKRPIASHPRAVGVITSLGAAALHDVLTAMSRRAPHVRAVIYPSAVQGADAPSQLAEAIALAGRRDEVDTLILCRGGGSMEDLWAFNDERVVRAVASSAIPLICGVGHETDLTLAELAADLRAPTPTAAAELATPMREEELTRLQSLSQSLARAARRRLDAQAQRLDLTALQFGRPARALARHSARLQSLGARTAMAAVQQVHARRRTLDELAHRWARARAAWLQAGRQRLHAAAIRLEANDPHRVLARGYAWLSDAQDRAVTTIDAVQPGQPLSVQWADGRAQVDVISVERDSP